MTYDPAGVEKASRDLLVAIGEDPEREGLVGTPDRMARAWREMCKGLTEDPREHLHTQFHAGTDELVQARLFDRDQRAPRHHERWRDPRRDDGPRPVREPMT